MKLITGAQHLVFVCFAGTNPTLAHTHANALPDTPLFPSASGEQAELASVNNNVLKKKKESFMSNRPSFVSVEGP